MFHGEPTGHVPRGTETIPPPQGPPRIYGGSPASMPQEQLQAAREALELGLTALEYDREPATVDRLAQLAILLASWAPRMNLTGHRGADQIARRLILDALALIRVLPDFETLADLGSGAGFPGLPIAILFPDRSVLSVESRSRRVSFQKTVVRELGLENVTILLGRIQELDPVEADGVVAQAVAPPERVLDLMLPWCRSGGWLAIPGTPDSLAPPPAPAPSYSNVEELRYRVPLEGPERRVWLAKKLAPRS